MKLMNTNNTSHRLHGLTQINTCKPRNHTNLEQSKTVFIRVVLCDFVAQKMCLQFFICVNPCNLWLTLSSSLQYFVK